MKTTNGPIRLDPDLLTEAANEAVRQHRSTPKQIEFWAALGKAADGLLTQEDLLALRTGLLRLEVVDSPRINPTEVRQEVEASRDRLKGEVTRARHVYQASLSHPGYIEQIHPDGLVVVGRFENGTFVPAKDQ